MSFGFQATAPANRKRNNLGSFAVARRFADACLSFCKALLRSYPPLPPIDADRVLFLEISRNHHHALHPIVVEMPQASQVIEDADIRVVRNKFAILWAPLFLPAVLYRWWKAEGYELESFRWAFDHYLHCHGLYFEYRRWLHRSKPRAIVFSNDHVSWSCALRAAAQDEGIPTVYVQHACVTESFPPLEFDFALLDGEDAMRKYRCSGKSNTVVRLIGIPKLDREFNTPRLDTTGPAFAISFNAIDSEDEISTAMQLAAAARGERCCYVRPHPACSDARQNRIRQQALRLGLQFSNPKTEAPFDFLRRLDAIICGTSAIALEAALMDVAPVVVMDENAADYYGFVQSGLATPAGSVAEAIALIPSAVARKQLIRNRAKQYCATIGTEFEGKSAALAARLIQEIANTGRLADREDVESCFVADAPPQ